MKFANGTLQVLGRTEERLELGLYASLTIEPFMRNVYDHSKGGAFPHNSQHPWTPFELFVDYLNPRGDERAASLVRESADIIHQTAITEGQSSPDALLYSNYARRGTNLTLLFGGNLERLRMLKKRYDPYDIISLTGGWKL